MNALKNINKLLIKAVKSGDDQALADALDAGADTRYFGKKGEKRSDDGRR